MLLVTHFRRKSIIGNIILVYLRRNVKVPIIIMRWLISRHLICTPPAFGLLAFGRWGTFGHFTLCLDTIGHPRPVKHLPPTKKKLHRENLTLKATPHCVYFPVNIYCILSHSVLRHLQGQHCSPPKCQLDSYSPRKNVSSLSSVNVCKHNHVGLSLDMFRTKVRNLCR